MKNCLGSGSEIMSPSDFGICVGLMHTHFHNWWFPILDGWNWVWILNIIWTGWRRRTIWLKIWLGVGESPLTLWRVEIVMEIIVIRWGTWVILIRIRPIRHTRLVKVMICRVGNIRKRVWCVIWIIIEIEKIVIIGHITQWNTNKKKEKQTNKQRKRKKILI